MTPQRDSLMRRNALWAQLRALEPTDPDFEAALTELGALIGWDRARVLGGLGLTGPELTGLEPAELELPDGPTQSQDASDPPARPARQAGRMTDQQHDHALEQERPDPSTTAPAEGADNAAPAEGADNAAPAGSASRDPGTQDQGRGQGADLAYDAPPAEGERDD
jgi:hypothetical protein